MRLEADTIGFEPSEGTGKIHDDGNCVMQARGE
jgi:hypothetical protein